MQVRFICCIKLKHLVNLLFGSSWPSWSVRASSWRGRPTWQSVSGACVTPRGRTPWPRLSRCCPASSPRAPRRTTLSFISSSSETLGTSCCPFTGRRSPAPTEQTPPGRGRRRKAKSPERRQIWADAICCRVHTLCHKWSHLVYDLLMVTHQCTRMMLSLSWFNNCAAVNELIGWWATKHWTINKYVFQKTALQMSILLSCLWPITSLCVDWTTTLTRHFFGITRNLLLSGPEA